MTWILLALISSLFWAGTNIFDKYALSKITRGSYDFLFFGSIGSFFLFTLTFFVFGVENTGIIALLPIISGFILQYSYLFYSYGLKREDASYISPLFITYAVVVLILSPLFGETITMFQLSAFFIVFFGAIILSLEKLSLNIFKYRKAALLMIPAIILVSFYALLINESLELLSFTDVFIYDALGFSLAALSLLLVPKWRQEIILGIKTASLRKYKLFFINDTLDASALLCNKFALLLAPSVSLVSVLSGVQPFFVLVIGALFTFFLPNVLRENISRREVTQKLIGMTIIVIGIIILNLYS